jgi:hypothetical protein
LHHPLDAEAFRDSVELVEVEAFAAPALCECLESHVQADCVPEPKAIHDRAGETIDANDLTLDAVLFDSKVEQRWRDVDDLERGSLEPRHAASPWHRDPDPLGKLGANPMKA